MTSLCTHCPVSGGGPGTKSARTPRLRGSHETPPSTVSNVPTAEMATHIRSRSVGCGMIVWRMRPPAPGDHVGRDGWFVKPWTWLHVRPPSSLRNRPAGPTPAYSASCAAVTFQTAVIFGPSSPYVMPSLDWVQLAPRSSLRNTVGPYHSLPPPA